jgi:cytochrome c
MRHMFRILLSLVAVASAILSQSPAQAAPRFHVLVFSKVNGFVHDSIPAGKAAIQALGTANNFQVTVSDDANVFTDAGLSPYQAVIFNNTNGRDGAILTATQRAAFERYIRAGNGYVGVHSASGTEYDWTWYQNLIGATFKSHPAIQQVSVEVDDRVHPATRGLPQNWVRTEEPYDFTANPRGNVHVLASFDTRNYAGHTMGADHPIAWCQDFEGGRSFYTGLGHAITAYDEPLFRSHLLGGIEWAAGAVAGDCGATEDQRYEKILLDGNTDDPLDLDIDVRGRVFFVQRGGAVKVYDPAVRFTRLAATFHVLVEHTHGMHGIKLDPNFATNHWLYLYYSPLSPPVSRVSRFTFDESTGTLDLASERVLLSFNAQRTHNAHEGGGMAFDNAGNLLIATGDNSSPCCSGFGPIDERPGFEYNDAQRSSGNTNDLRGKILRIHPEANGTYTVPAGNLFAPGTASTRPEIYVMGLRQPYRISVDSETNWLYWGEVGPDAQADSATRGPLGYDEFNQARTAGNYGWPYCIGANRPYIDFNFATGASGAAFNCTGGPANNSPNNTGRATLPAARPAWLPYTYGVTAAWPELGSGGRLAIGGPTYHFDAASPSEQKFPLYYDDTLFVADWTRNAIFELKQNSAGNPFSINRFLPSVQFLRPIDIEFGPDGSMYVIEWGSNYGGSGRGDPNFDSGIYKISFVRPGERSPVARGTATPTSGRVPLSVQFSSAGSTDPDAGQAVTFGWDFTNNGSIDSTLPNPSFTYTANGDYTARLVVTDPTNRSSVVNIPITVGNTAPTVTLTAPLDGQVFDFGGNIPFSVAVTDPEDGTINCQDVVTQPALGHAQHAHPLETHRGCSGVIESIVDDGHTSNDNLFYVVDSKYTDRGATGVSRLTGGDSAVLQPRHKEADHHTRQQGTQVVDVLDGQPALGKMLGHIANGDWASFEPVNLNGIDRIRFRVASAGSGGTIEVRRGSPTGPLLGSVAVPNTGGWRTFTTVTADITDPGGSYEMYLVFRNPSATGDLFNLDWMEFQPLVELTGMTLPTPIFGGTQANATVTVANRNTTAASVTVSLRVPSGWGTSPVTVSVPANGTVNVSVPVTAQGNFTNAQVTARATGAGGAPTVSTHVVPSAANAVRAIDAGSATSPLLSGYARLGPATAYTDAAGFGWVGTTTGLSDRDRGAPDPLKRDFVTSQSPATLRLKVPAGWHRVTLLRGDQGFAAQPLIVDQGTTRLLNAANLAAGQYSWEQFLVDGGPGGTTVDLRFSTSVANEWWRFNALILQAVSVSLALDAGSATSPVGVGYTRLTPADPRWMSNPELSDRDRGGPAPVRQDMVTSLQPATLRLPVPAGRHTIWILRGDLDFPAERLIVELNGVQVLASGVPIAANQWIWDHIAVDGGAAGRDVDLTFSNDEGKFWRVNAVILQ